MLTDWIPFTITIDTVMLTSSCLWSLGLYLASVTVKNWLIERNDSKGNGKMGIELR
jgi:hypothetical protein